MSEPTKTKRIPDLDVDEEMVQAQVLVPRKYMKKLGGLAVIKETSKGAIVRDALRKYFDEQDKVMETPEGAKVSNKVVKDLLKRCTTFWGNVNVEGDEGFIALCKEKGVKLKDLTYEQFGIVADKLRIGYNGYVVKPSVDEFIGKLSVLEPTEEQKDLLREALGGGGGQARSTWICEECDAENPSDAEECQECEEPRGTETEEGEQEKEW